MEIFLGSVRTRPHRQLRVIKNKMRRATKITLILAVLVFTQSWLVADTKTQPESSSSPATRMKDFKESSPLLYALARKHYDQALVEMGLVPDIDAVDSQFGHTALCLAARDESSDAYDMVRALVLQYGANPDTTDGQGLTALHYATAAGNLPVVQFLLTYGADVNAALDVGGEKVTPLYMAYQGQRQRVASFLLQHGANEIDVDIKKDLDVQAAISASIQNMPRRLTEEGTLEDLVQGLLRRASRAAAETLLQQGRPEEAAAAMEMLDVAADVMADMPPITAETDRRAVVSAVMQSTVAKLQNRIHAAKPE